MKMGALPIDGMAGKIGGLFSSAFHSYLRAISVRKRQIPGMLLPVYCCLFFLRYM